MATLQNLNVNNLSVSSARFNTISADVFSGGVVNDLSSKINNCVKYDRIEEFAKSSVNLHEQNAYTPSQMKVILSSMQPMIDGWKTPEYNDLQLSGKIYPSIKNCFSESGKGLIMHNCIFYRSLSSTDYDNKNTVWDFNENGWVLINRGNFNMNSIQFYLGADNLHLRLTSVDFNLTHLVSMWEYDNGVFGQHGDILIQSVNWDYKADFQNLEIKIEGCTFRNIGDSSVIEFDYTEENNLPITKEELKNVAWVRNLLINLFTKNRFNQNADQYVLFAPSEEIQIKFYKSEVLT